MEELRIGEDGKPTKDDKGHIETTGRTLFTVARCAADIKRPTLAYRIAALTVGQDPTTGNSIAAPYVVWEENPVDVTADQAVTNSREARGEHGRKEKAQSAASFLEDMLASGHEIPIKTIQERAAGRFSKDQLDRAKAKIKAETRKQEGVGGGWVWYMPPKPFI